MSKLENIKPVTCRAKSGSIHFLIAAVSFVILTQWPGDIEMHDALQDNKNYLVQKKNAKIVYYARMKGNTNK